ncbi:glycosyltransferase [Latilactobacillus curvatus]|uniref:glycosyltransferase n=1 Tax=Latilactobacillus curvatus TaxID=28038 RepID=UPI0009787993|nr:glycosyltransferase [Latilactobacillus curvatus]MCT1215755.1 glycosyltransferase [Latilactobacillus curvatus]
MEKVMHLLFSDRFGGAEKVAIDIIKNINKENAVYVSKKGPIEDILKKNKVDYILLDKITYREIEKVIKKRKVTIVHAHDFKASILASLFYKKCTILSHIHQSPKWMNGKNIRTLIYKLREKKFKTIILASSEIKNSRLFLKTTNTTIIPNYVDVGTVPSNTAKSYTFVFVGRLEPEKDPFKFLEFIKKFQRLNRNINAVMIGDGTLKKDIEESIVSENLNVKVAGFIGEPYTLVMAAKFLVVSSIKEGFGIAIIEAMQLGVPVISEDVGGVTSLIDEKTGIIVKDLLDIENINKMMQELDYTKLAITAKKFGETYNVRKKWVDIFKKIYD